MNQANQTGNGNGGGQGTTSTPNAPQFTPPQTGGNGNQQQGNTQGQQSSQADPYANGGDPNKGTEDLGEYGADGNLKQKPAPKHEAVDLKYKIEGLEDLTDDEATQIKEFAKSNRLSKEQAQAYLTNYKGVVDKNFQSVKAQEKTANDKILAKKQEEVKKLVAAIGGKDGADFKQNYAKLGQFIGKHMPEFKKALDGGEFFPPSSVMKELFDFQESMTKEDSLVNGGAAGGKAATGGGLFGFFGGNKT
jgi:hypothetical protein